MINKFQQYADDSEMVQIFNTDIVKAYYGQKEADHFGTFLMVSDYDPTTPVLLYDWARDSGGFLSAKKMFGRNVYNNFDQTKLGKIATLRKLVADGVDWVPRTAFTADPGWGGVKFPAICKAANSYDSKGVEKIDSKKDVPDYIDIVQDIIEIDREFRVVAFRGKSNDRTSIIQILEKTPKNEKAKDLRVDESLSKEEMKNRPNTKFSWKILVPRNEDKLIPDMSKIIKYIFNDNPGLNFAGFDIAFDTAGKGWYIEHNMLPAPIGPTFLILYSLIFQDWYNRPLCDEMQERILELAPKYCKGTKAKVDLDWDDPMPGTMEI